MKPDHDENRTREYVRKTVLLPDLTAQKEMQHPVPEGGEYDTEFAVLHEFCYTCSTQLAE